MLRIGVRHIYHFAFWGQWFPNKQGTSFAQTENPAFIYFQDYRGHRNRKLPQQKQRMRKLVSSILEKLQGL